MQQLSLRPKIYCTFGHFPSPCMNHNTHTHILSHNMHTISHTNHCSPVQSQMFKSLFFFVSAAQIVESADERRENLSHTHTHTHTHTHKLR